MKRRSSPVSVLELGRKPPSHERHGGNAMAACEYAAVFEYFITLAPILTDIDILL